MCTSSKRRIGQPFYFAHFAMAPTPVAVSPLIKFARYSALLVGIAYGSRHNKTLAKKEAEILAIKKVHDEKEAVRKAEEAKAAAAGDTGSIFD